MRIEVSVLACGHDVADARLHRLCGAFGRAGLTVELLGIGDAADAPPVTSLSVRERGGRVARALRAVRYAAAARGRVLLAVDPDGLLAAAVVARLRRRRLVADVHEDYASLLRDRAWAGGAAGRVAQAVAALATRAAAGADLTLVADDHVPPRRTRRRLVVRNVADPHVMGSLQEPAATPTAVYVGDVRRSRGLFTMLEALSQAPQWTLDVVGPVSADDNARLDAILAADSALAARVRLHGRRPPAQSWQIAGSAWAGLALLDDTPAFRDAVPSKVYEYAAAGLVPIVTDLPRQAEVARAYGGVVVNSAAAAAEALRALAQTGPPSRASRVLEATVTTTSPYDECAEAVAELARG